MQTPHGTLDDCVHRISLRFHAANQLKLIAAAIEIVCRSIDLKVGIPLKVIS